MNNNNAKTLIGHLEQEVNWIESLNTLLAEEKNALGSSQFDKLSDLADQKQDLTAKLEESAKQRNALLSADKPIQSIKLSLQDFLKNCSEHEAKQINKLNLQLMEQLAICRDLNTINGQVIANNIHTRQQIVSALSGGNTDSTSVYTSNGDLSSSSGTNHHQEA
ncbi:flagella synthesis protein FlgN [Legionella worsleiensis]|uniref:Flagellar biosynthesis/type III secretory pathway chaperone n=1 Tax=Legionella worsleiensis TaxID=45076 RepID=A0A0W1A3U4_9GAMM|nr:flagellar protein FlgN [Legionella worsleiensis]KTD76030.1 flagellar biosynthesis/type III secretory pathway chaperone [Legionella worsleiensis]STY33044.1 flagella synthesis protein FlgN [Legionella worsleiensis]